MSWGAAGVRIGHWTSETGKTGCTVLLFDDLTPAVVDVRGGAPGTRETDLLRVGSLVGAVDAILLTGGSAFGLSAADGVMRFLEEADRGVPTSAGRVPIVSGAVIFDLDPAERVVPGPDAGYTAAQAAEPIPDAFAGHIGGGAGATYQKLWGAEHVRRGGLAVATVQTPLGAVRAVVVLNAVGTSSAPHVGGSDGVLSREALLAAPPPPTNREATTIGAIIVETPSDRDLLTRCTIAAHDGLARSIVPAHTLHDGDLFYAAGIGSGEPVDDMARMVVPIAAEMAVEQAISAIVSLAGGM